ncbi:MAG: hypothetical protein Q8L41_12505 [Anaerolineales bacterium]|nr:hypothetical protein [Anaerolineales bacterium]
MIEEQIPTEPMMGKNFLTLFILILLLTSCSPASHATVEPFDQTPPAETSQDKLAPAVETFTTAGTLIPSPTTATFTPILPTVTSTSTPTPIPFVDNLKASVTADLLSCRYGPGSEYLFLFALNKGANIRLIGRAEGNHWVLVENEPQRCWVNANFVEIKGDLQTLKPMYPDGFKLILSPSYAPPTVLTAERKRDEITVTWLPVPVSRGDYEDDSMFPYMIEVWRCENGEIIFDPLVSRFPLITFVDQAGCNLPSHGRVFVQEKHGYAGPAEIPWPAP